MRSGVCKDKLQSTQQSGAPFWVINRALSSTWPMVILLVSHMSTEPSAPAANTHFPLAEVHNETTAEEWKVDLLCIYDTALVPLPLFASLYGKQSGWEVYGDITRHYSGLARCCVFWSVTAICFARYFNCCCSLRLRYCCTDHGWQS